MDDEQNERTPLLGAVASDLIVSTDISATDTSKQTGQPLKVFKRRWWILTVFCFVNATQSVLWNTWSPIGDAMLICYDWKASFLALCLCGSSISVAVMSLPVMYIVETRGKFLTFLLSCLSLFEMNFL